MAKRTSTSRKLVHRRATWAGGAPENTALHVLPVNLCEARRKVHERPVVREDGSTICMSRWEPYPSHDQLTGFQAELLAFTQGRAAEIAHTGLLDDETLNVDVQQPEIGRDFLRACLKLSL